MSSFKCFFFLFSVALVASQAQAAPLAANERIIKDITKGLIEFKNLGADILDAGNKLVAGEDYDTIINTLNDNINEKTTIMIDMLVDILKELSKTSSKIGPKVPGCISSSESLIINTITTAVGSFASCFKSDLLTIAPELGPFFNTFSVMRNRDIEIGQGIYDCKDADCYKNIGVKIILNVISRLPDYVTDLKPIVLEHPTMGASALRCAAGAGLPLVSNIGQIWNRINSCKAN